jgi:hypothetical protein
VGEIRKLHEQRRELVLPLKQDSTATELVTSIFSERIGRGPLGCRDWLGGPVALLVGSRLPVRNPLTRFPQIWVSSWENRDLRVSRMVRTLPHQEGHVALKGLGGRRHLDRSRTRANWYGGLDFGLRDHGKHSRRTVEGDAGCSLQICSQDCDGCPDLAGGGSSFRERTKPHAKAKDRATAKVTCITRAAVRSCSVEDTARGLN